MPTNIPRTIYHLILQDHGRGGVVVADIVSDSPFPRIESGDAIETPQTQPRCWDVKLSMLKVEPRGNGEELHVMTCLLVNSPCEREPVPEVRLT